MSFRVLVVDDDEHAYLAARDLLARAQPVYETDWVRSGPLAVDRVASTDYDAILLDYRLAGERGPEVLGQIRHAGYDGPAIMLTGSADPDHDHASMEAGASDYLVKAELTAPRLERALRYAIARDRDLRSARSEVRRAVDESLTDSLTGLGNRRRFDRALEETVESSVPTILVVADLNELKQINDTYGHPAGDRALRLLATQLRRLFRTTDLICRIGGDEFGVLVEDDGSGRLAARIGPTIWAEDDVIGRVTASVGVSRIEPGSSATLAVRRADRDLYHAKFRGRVKPAGGIAR